MIDSEVPLPSSVGPYRITARISQGAGGVVYRAVHPDVERPVALKALFSRHREDLECLRREIYTLACVRHSGVVSILDHGVEDGLPWYAMELLEEPTLEERWNAGRDAVEPSRVTRLFARLCDTLAFLHGEGVVHRDLKPANVMLRPNDEPVLVDFGFASHFAGAVSRESLEAGGLIYGTPIYMSPEQFRGEYVDARSDLFSVGIMMYEALTARLPFTLAERDLWTGRARAAAPRPSCFADVPRPLEDLVLSLLHNEPAERPGYASDIAAALRQMSGERGYDDPTVAPTYLYRAGFVGRNDPLATMDGLFAEAGRGRGGVAMVAGESGVGKTRFAMEATRRATESHMRVLTGECLPIRSNAGGPEVHGAALHPFVPLLRAIADDCRYGGAAATAEILGPRARTLAAFESSLASVPGFDSQPEPESLDGEAARARILSDLIETIAAFMRRTPTLMVIDDLQWADDLSIAALSSLAAGAAAEMPAVFLGTYRSGEATPAVERLAASPGATLLELGRLDTQSLTTMVGAMLAVARPPADLMEALLQRCEGNPLFVGEYLRAAVATEVLQRDRGHWQMRPRPFGEPVALWLPGNVKNLILDRLRRLPPGVLDVVQAASVFGRELDAAALRQLASLDGDRELEVLSTLVRGKSSTMPATANCDSRTINCAKLPTPSYRRNDVRSCMSAPRVFWRPATPGGLRWRACHHNWHIIGLWQATASA